MKTKSSLSWRRALVAIGGLMIGAHFAFGQSWMLTSAPITNWNSVASSADGARLVAAAGVPHGSGALYISTNSGATWLHTSAPTPCWISVASSADGNRLIAASPDYFSGGIYISTNAGVNWTRTSVTASNNYWACVGSSADGSKLVVADLQTARFYPSRLFVSTNSGISWAECLVASGESRRLASCSADGTIWLSAPSYASHDCGQTWVGAAPSWISAFALSSDGRKCVGALAGAGIIASTNSAATWTNTGAPVADWTGLASSADGARLVGVANSGPIYTSANSGVDWIQANAPVTNWSSVASSADGSKLVAVVKGGAIYTWHSAPAPVLAIARSGTNLVNSWTIPALNFVLQQNTNLNPANWVDVPIAPTLNTSNLQNQVTLPATKGMIFYRLAAQLPD